MDKIDVLQRRKQIEHKLSKTNYQYQFIRYLGINSLQIELDIFTIIISHFSIAKLALLFDNPTILWVRILLIQKWYLPTNPGLHWHKNPSNISIQDPPLLQGWLAQSSIKCWHRLPVKPVKSIKCYGLW